MEPTTTARVIGGYGHEVKLIAPQFVKAYLRGQKNDAQDGAASCEVASRPEMRLFRKSRSSGKIYKRFIECAAV